MAGIAWASCWPAAFQSARENNPTLVLLGAICALLPDLLDSWIVKPFRIPDLHIVPPPEAPDPHMIADALVNAISHSRTTGRRLKITCYPIPLGPNLWTPYTLHFDSARKRISVRIDGANPVTATAAISVGFITHPTSRLAIHDEPLSLQAEPLADHRIAIMVMAATQPWSHSFVLALTLGALVTGIWGLTAGAIAGGAYALHIFINQWGFAGCTLLWPLKHRRYPGFQWVKSSQTQPLDLAVLWLSLLLIAGNIIRTTIPEPEGPSLLQLLLFGGAIPLAILSRLRLNKPHL